jgi:hypothetical protein
MNLIGNNIQSEIYNIIPCVLIDYLCELVKKSGTMELITLIPSKLGFGAVQEIICETASGTIMKRVFGFVPVSTQLEVLRNGDHFDMMLAV